MMRKLTAAGCVLWIAGLTLFIAGLNIPGETGRWMAVIGNIVFLAGLWITGAVWFKKKKDEGKDADKE